MHELSIAMAIIDVVTAEVERQDGTSVQKVFLKIGPLSGIVSAALVSAFELAREGTLLAEAELQIEAAPLIVFCPTCQAERPPVSIQELCCSECGTVAGQVVSGRELDVVAMEIT